jgi:hypothetical protein
MLIVSFARVLEEAAEGAVGIIFAVEIIACNLTSLAIYLLGFAYFSFRPDLEISLDFFNQT